MSDVKTKKAKKQDCNGMATKIKLTFSEAQRSCIHYTYANPLITASVVKVIW